MAPLSPPSAPNRAPAPVMAGLDLGRALGRGERGGRTGCHTGGWGTALLPIPAPGWQLGCMYQVRREAAGRLAHSEWASRVISHAPHRPLRLPEWVRGALATKTEHLNQYSKLELAVRHFYLLLTAT
jgi:hypothetical protein